MEMERQRYGLNRKPIISVPQFQNTVSFPSDFIHTDARKFIQRYNLLNEFRKQVAEEEKIKNMRKHQFIPVKFAFYKESDANMDKQIKNYQESVMFTQVAKSTNKPTFITVTDIEEEQTTQKLEETLKLDNQVKNVKKRMSALKDALQIRRPPSAAEIKESLSYITRELNSGRQYSQTPNYVQTQIRPHTASSAILTKSNNSMNRLFFSQHQRPSTTTTVKVAVTPVQQRLTPPQKGIKRNGQLQNTVIQ